jgi:integrase
VAERSRHQFIGELTEPVAGAQPDDFVWQSRTAVHFR